MDYDAKFTKGPWKLWVSMDANAHLIAAAPDLYEALRWIADQYANQDLSHVDFRVEAARRAEAALSKAQPTNPTAQGDEQ